MDGADHSGQDPLLAGLREAGLSRYEASVYLGLVTDQTAKVVGISKRTGVPQPKVYQALDSLVEKGFCTLGSDAVNRYQPVPPRVALEGQVAKLQTEQDDLHRLGRDLEVRLRAGRGQELWAPPIEIVKGMGQISRVLTQRIESAQQEVCFFGKAPIVRAQEVSQAFEDAGARGVSLRLLFEEAFLDKDEAPEEVAHYLAMKASKRRTDSLPTKLLLIDDHIGLASISRAGGGSFLMLVLRHDGLLAHFRSSFEYRWNAAEPLAG